jgi:hypothetical protein
MGNVGNIVTLFTTFVGGALAATGRITELAVMERILRPMTLITSFGLLGDTLAKALINFLPTGLSSLLCTLTGTPDQKLDEQINSWMAMAQIVLTLSKTTRFLISPYYHSLCRAVYAEGSRLLAIKGITPAQVSRITANYTKIVSLSSTVFLFENSIKDRDIPFYIHLSGAPGVGKTLIAERLLHEIFPASTFSGGGVYTRSDGTFWSGFTGQKHILYDEFMVGPEVELVQHYGEIL